MTVDVKGAFELEINIQERIKEAVRIYGPEAAKEWGADFRRNKFKLRLKKQKIYEKHLECGFDLKKWKGGR